MMDETWVVVMVVSMDDWSAVRMVAPLAVV